MVLVVAMIMAISISAFANESSVKVNSSKIFAFNDSDVESYDEKIPQVNYRNDINGYDKFVFKKGLSTRTTEEPSSEWDWSEGAYSVNGSSNSATLYTNYYFTGVVGRTFDFTAGSSNRITVDLVHKGWIFQTVVSTWTIDAGESKSVEIKESDLDGESKDGKYYFRFNSNPLGNSYSVTGTFE
ncbi:hypothetical protein [Maledivibacter halophilus]|nr:hypothetical protein [Maledivibacter halophilus]